MLIPESDKTSDDSDHLSISQNAGQRLITNRDINDNSNSFYKKKDLS